jgi:hypothetical protein
MTNGKIEFSLGSLSFSGEGEQEWLAKQLDKILEAAPDLHNIKSSDEQDIAKGQATQPSGEFKETLAGYIKAKGAENNQVKRFLATADWLRRRGTSELTTSAVTKALSNNHQKKLSNPADSLNKNVSKGHCEKNGTGFFITPDGLTELGSQ